MDDIRSKFVVSFFGPAWKQLVEQADTVGAFVLWHDTREFYADPTVEKLLGSAEKQLSYEELSSVAEYAEVGGNSLPQIRTVLLDSGDAHVTAAVVMRIEDRKSTPSLDLPVVTQSQLSEIISMGSGRSFLMLIQLEHIDYERDEESFIRSALDALKKVLPEGSVIAGHTRLQYWIYVPRFDQDPEPFAKMLRHTVKHCSITDEFEVLVSDTHSMTFTGGYVAESDSTAVTLFHYASFALFEALSEKVGSIRAFSPEHYDVHKNDYRNVQSFTTLLDKNLFFYHFQPIVNAKDGSIVAYEALMRTDKSIGLNPLQILDMAQKYDRLYEIEYATMFNVMEHLSRNQGYFKKRKLFINAIPSSFLTEDDWNTLRSNYGELMEKIVIELTEQTDTSDETLKYVMNRLRSNKIRMAIDDYGTGYSNTSRLIKYTPDYIKIDHSLISHIDTNARLQNIVNGLVEMMHQNGFSVLAEGVETTEELRTLIEMNIDLFQGFYISRPKPIFINEISETVQAEIIRYGLEAKENLNKIYYAEDGAHIKLEELIRDHYTRIHISSGDVHIEGEDDSPEVNIPINIMENSQCTVTFRNVRIDANIDEPAVAIGSGSDVTLVIEGENLIRKSGIQVPSKSSLTMVGDGDLTILPEAISCYGIGNEDDLTYGRIRILMTGKLMISTNGDNCVGIGGGRSDSGTPIELESTEISLVCSGASSIGIGSMHERCDVHMNRCKVSIEAASAVFVGVGSHESAVSLIINDSDIYISSGGNKMCGMGLLKGHSCYVYLKNSTFETNMRGRDIINVGTNDGKIDLNFVNTKVKLYGEGGSISGIGDSLGEGSVRFQDSDVDIVFLTGNGFGLGSARGDVEFNGGSKNIKINT